jgi:CMP-N,N'-diacetyllegionaminic acid synthase
MIEIVRDALERVPGSPQDIWILLQPSSPLRTKNQITTAIDLLKFTGSDSVVTVRRAVSCDALLVIDFIAGTLRGVTRSINTTPRRQQQQACFVRDGTAYVFWRRTVRDFDHIYGVECRPMIINDEQSLSIDTPQDWSEAERRLKAIENARLAS